MSKWIKGLKIKPNTLNLIKEKTENILKFIGISEDFLQNTKSVGTKRTPNKWDITKMKSCCKAKDTINRKIRQHTEWEKSFLPVPYLIEDWYQKHIKKLKKQISKNQTIQLKWGTSLKT